MCQCFLSVIPIYLRREGDGQTPGGQGGRRMNQVPLPATVIAMKAQLIAILSLTKDHFYIVTRGQVYEIRALVGS